MAVIDPIADFLTRIRNAQMAAHETVTVSHSKAKEAIARILKEEGYIVGYVVGTDRGLKNITVTLKYVGDREPAIRKLTRLSRPGRRQYVGKEDIPQVLGGLGITILSTSRGLMTGRNARQQGLGGELLLEVY
ncbi:MAG: 30S ribosomal protein S8 [Acidobacteriota bacterium]